MQSTGTTTATVGDIELAYETFGDPGGTPLPPKADDALPQVPQSETGLPLTAWASTRVAPARRPDGSVVYVKADHVVAGLEPDPIPDSEAPKPEPPSIAALDEATTPAPTEVVAATRFTHPGTVLVPSGAKSRARANIAALEVLTETARTGRPATPAEHEVLAQWSGWGAAADIFDESKPEWAPERDQLRALLDSEQWRQAIERAAARMVHGVLEGHTHVMLSPVTQVGSRVHGLAPSFTTRLMGLANRVLPTAPAVDPLGPGTTVEGRVARQGLTGRARRVVDALSTLGDRAGEQNNERGA